MSNRYFKGRARRTNILGAILHRATETVPQTTEQAIFYIIGGKVLLTSIVGEITVEPGAALNVKLLLDPTATTAGEGDLCATVDINTCTVGDLLSITGKPGTAMLVAHKGAVQTMDMKGVALQVGTLEFDSDASTTGAVKWTLTYVPIDDGAEMIVA